MRKHKQMSTFGEVFRNRFNRTWSNTQIETCVSGFRAHMRETCEKSYPSREEHDAVPKDERRALGQQAFDRILATIQPSHASAFDKFMFWMGDWWYYHPELNKAVHMDRVEIWDFCQKSLFDFIKPALPRQIANVVEDMEMASVAMGGVHFALLFIDNDRGVRRIVTDTQLFELHEVSGYTYLDIDHEGKVMHRCVTERGGGRAFFDGVRLMAHDRFQTCAPKTSFFEGGYMVNSTRVTIVNGILLPLVNPSDRVAHTTGAFMGTVDFSKKDALKSFRLSDQTANRLRVSNSQVFLDNAPQTPLGSFARSRTTVLKNGFTLVDYATFRPYLDTTYRHIMVVDDNTDWIARVVEQFQSISRIDTVHTRNRKVALRQILKHTPEVVLLDMHLTEEETFDGLWISSQLSQSGYQGRILFTSSYDDAVLAGFTAVSRGREAPGKNLERLKTLLGKKP